MGQRLFDMTDAQLDAAVESYYDSLYKRFYNLGEPDPVCMNCRHYSYGRCSVRENELDTDDVSDEEYYKQIEVDPEDYCDEHEFMEADYPDDEDDER